MRIIVCGDRNWDDYATIEFVLDDILNSCRDEEFILIEGGARGADQMAAFWAASRVQSGVERVCIPADWKNQHCAAGPIRNKKMLDLNPDLVVAFHLNINNSRGTKNMLHISEKAGVVTMLVDRLV